MPRVYYCKKCGVSHDPPTGKHCKQREHEATNTTDPSADILTLLMDIQGKVAGIEQQTANIDNRVRTIEDNQQSPRPTDRAHTPETSEDIQEGGATSASPQTLREDTRLMRQAASRLARLQLDDSDDEEFGFGRNARYHGKKSGAEMTAADKVERRIDWPHWYVRRSVGGKRKPLTFSELRLEEFVFGFLDMIDSPKCKWDYRVMTQILKQMMRDTIAGRALVRFMK